MSAIQLNLFETYDENALLRQEIFELRESMHKQRKSQFAKLNAMGKEIIEIKEELYALKASQLKRVK